MMTEDDDDYGFLMAMMTRSSANLNFQKSAKAYYRPEDCWVRHQSFVQGQKESSRANDPSSSCLQSFFFSEPKTNGTAQTPSISCFDPRPFSSGGGRSCAWCGALRTTGGNDFGKCKAAKFYAFHFALQLKRICSGPYPHATNPDQWPIEQRIEVSASCVLHILSHGMAGMRAAVRYMFNREYSLIVNLSIP